MMVDPAELVGPAEIATRLAVAPNTVSMWRARGLLPAPVAVISRVPVWDWADVREWAVDTSRMPAVTDTHTATARALLPQVRAQVAASVRSHAETLAPLLAERMARPPRKLEGDGRGNGRGEWDWFFALSRATREHLARRFMVEGGLAPDLYAAAMGVEDVETACGAWLAAARAVDAWSAVKRGRAPLPGTEADGYDVHRLYSDAGAEYLASILSADEDRAHYVRASGELPELEAF